LWTYEGDSKKKWRERTKKRTPNHRKGGKAVGIASEVNWPVKGPSKKRGKKEVFKRSKGRKGKEGIAK